MAVLTVPGTDRGRGTGARRPAAVHWQVAKLTNSVPALHESRKVPLEDEGMRYLAASIGFLTTLVLVAPFH